MTQPLSLWPNLARLLYHRSPKARGTLREFLFRIRSQFVDVKSSVLKNFRKIRRKSIVIPLDGVAETGHVTPHQSQLDLSVFDHVTVVVVQNVLELAAFLLLRVTDAVFQNDVVRAVSLQNAINFAGRMSSVYLIDLNRLNWRGL